MSKPPTIPPTMTTQQHSSVPITFKPEYPHRPTRSLALDLYRGVVWGDFDRDLGVAGAAAQSTIGFIPIAGTLAALRDLMACIGQRDPLGAFLNLLALFPVFGGFAKIADAVHTLHRYHRAAQRRKRRVQATLAYQPSTVAAPIPRRRRSGWASFGLALLLTCITTLYSFAVGLLFGLLWANGPTIQGYSLRGSGAWLAPLILLPSGLLVGIVATVANRLWLGLIALPFAILFGLACAAVLLGLV